MACKLELRGQRMPFLWNVSNKVGDSVKAANSPSDVELVSFFLDFIHSGLRGQMGYGYVRQLNVRVNSEYDASTAYAIYNFQSVRKNHTVGMQAAAIDGLISPARHFDPVKWTIVHMNEILFIKDRNAFMNLTSDNRLSPGLRLELAGMNRVF